MGARQCADERPQHELDQGGYGGAAMPGRARLGWLRPSPTWTSRGRGTSSSAPLPDFGLSYLHAGWGRRRRPGARKLVASRRIWCHLLQRE